MSAKFWIVIGILLNLAGTAAWIYGDKKAGTL